MAAQGKVYISLHLLFCDRFNVVGERVTHSAYGKIFCKASLDQAGEERHMATGPHGNIARRVVEGELR